MSAEVGNDRFSIATEGGNDCVVDLCLVLGRLMKIGINNCDQLPLIQAAQLPPLTQWCRAAIARSWHKLSQNRLDAIRTAVVNEFRAQDSSIGEAAEGEERPYLYFNDVLDAFFLNARSVTYTLNPSSYCHRCRTAFLSDRPFIR